MAFDREIAAATVFGEASNQGYSGQLAVAWVIRNRRDSGRWGHTLAHVCLAYEQFSSWNGDRQSRANILRAADAPDSDAIILDCLKAVDAATSGSGIDPTGGAMFYYADSIAAPSWTVGATFTVQIGNQRFYKGVK